MIKVYTDKKLCQKPIILSNDKYFNTNVSTEYLDSWCRDIMKRVDGVISIDENTWVIITRFGTCDINSISTGLKTLLNIYNMRKKGISCTVDVREIGENLVEILLNLVDDSKICLYTGKNNFIGSVESNYNFIVNNIYNAVGTCDLSIRLEKLRFK